MYEGDIVMESFIDSIAIAIKGPSVPPVVSGAKALIQKLSEEEAKLEMLNNTKETIKYTTIPHEDISSIVLKYSSSDFRRDVYQFIK